MIQRSTLIYTDRAEVDLVLGFRTPDTLLRLFDLLKDASNRVMIQQGSLFHQLTGLQLADQDASQPGTPPELFIFGQTGIDSVNCGCVIHDERLGKEYPLACFAPDDVRVDYLGLDFRRGLGTLMGIAWQETVRENRDNHQTIKTLIEEMGFEVDQLPSEAPLNLRPRTPPGWKYATSADTLGVFAESKHFAPDQVFDTDPDSFERREASAYVIPAQIALSHGYPGTALWYLRNGYTFLSPEGMPHEIVDLMKKAYRALGRDFLIARLEKELTLHR